MRRSSAILAGLIGLLLAAQIFRVTVVSAYSATRPDIASRFAGEHPAALVQQAMLGVGTAAANGQDPDPQTRAQLHRLAVFQPLAVEPVLVWAAVAERAGDNKRALNLLEEARRRDPRSAAARYLLSDLDLRTGRISEGLHELADLSKVYRGSSPAIVPALAAFAKSGGAVAELRKVFAGNPQLEDPVLALLAEDATNADLILAAASRSADASPPAWQVKLLDSMVAKGDYAKAHAVWARLSGVPLDAPPAIFNEGFEPSAAPPPFNWRFLSNDAGIAQPEKGSLRVLFYGRDNAILATQLLLLGPGRYRLSVPITSTSGPDGALSWTVTCLRGRSPIFTLPLPGEASAKSVDGQFDVPANCPAQRLSLQGAIEESPSTSDLQVWPIDLRRIDG